MRHSRSPPRARRTSTGPTAGSVDLALGRQRRRTTSCGALAARGEQAAGWRHWVRGGDPATAAASARARQERELHQLRRPLPVDEPWDLDVRPFVVGPGRGRPGSRSTTAPSTGTPSRAAGRVADLAGARCAEPWFDPTGFLLHEDEGRLLGFCWTKVHADADAAARRDLRHRRRPGRRTSGASGGRSSLAGPRPPPPHGPRLWGCSTSTARNEAGAPPLRQLGFEVHHIDRGYTIAVPRMTATHPLRRRPRRPRARSSTASPRYRVDQVWAGPLRAAGRAGRAHEPAQGRCAPTLDERPAARPRARHRADERPRRDREVALGARPTAPRSRPSSCTTPTAPPSACRARPAARWAARSAPPARPASTATSHAARSSSRWCGPAAGPGTTGGGCPTWSSWAWASPWPTTTRRGPRSSGSTPTSACRPATSPCPPSASCPGIRRLAAEALPVNLAVSLHAADDALRDELVPINRRYPLQHPHGRLRRLPPGQGPAPVVRVGAHRRRQRPRRRRPQPRRAGPQPAAARPT